MERLVNADLSYVEDRAVFLSECPECGKDVVVIANEEPAYCDCPGLKWVSQPMVLSVPYVDAISDYYAIGAHYLSDSDIEVFERTIDYFEESGIRFVPAHMFDETWPGRRASFMELADQCGYAVFTGIGDAVDPKTGCPNSMGFLIRPTNEKA